MLQTSTPLTPEQMADWSAHCLACYPEEACAYIVNDKIYPVKNVSPEPTKRFAVSAIDRLAVEKAGKISGFLHSHPVLLTDDTTFPAYWPSGADMKSWFADDVRWGISACEGENVTEPVWLDNDYMAPLVGRHFIHGIWDCWSVVRDYYNIEYNIKLPNCARGMEWWKKGEDLYMANLGNAGFYDIPAEEVMPGDIVLLSIDHKVVNHAAVVIDHSTLLHHTYSRSGAGLSGYVPFGKWSKHVMKYMRHKEKQ